jgi:hypothetical protein
MCWRSAARAINSPSERLENSAVRAIFKMTAADLRNLLERIQTWPEEAQNELVAVASQIESELRDNEYKATRDELQVIDDAMASLDAGEVAADSVGSSQDGLSADAEPSPRHARPCAGHPRPSFS